VEHPADAELVARATAGDKAAFGILVECYTEMILHLTQSAVDDSELARDLSQEALLQAYLSLDQLRDVNRFRSWLYGIALNVCRSHLRSNRRDTLSLDALSGGAYHDPALFGPTVEELSERRELRLLLTNALASLSHANRAAVTLVYLDEYSLREAATLLGITETALKGRLHRARLHLQTRLQSEFHPFTVQKGEFAMVPVKIIDVRRREILKDSGYPINTMQVVLYDEANRRALVIWIGQAEADAILLGMGKYETPRPYTQTFILRLLGAARATVEQVTINALKDEIFYAVVQIQTAQGLQDIDARPSDALALATFANVPIYVNEEVMATAGRVIPADFVPTGKGMNDLESEGTIRAQIWNEHRLRQTAQTHDQLVDQVIAESFAAPATVQ